MDLGLRALTEHDTDELAEESIAFCDRCAESLELSEPMTDEARGNEG